MPEPRAANRTSESDTFDSQLVYGDTDVALSMTTTTADIKRHVFHFPRN